MLNMPSPGSFQNIGLLQLSSEHVKPCDSNWVKIKGAIENQLAQSDSSLDADQKW